MLKLLLNLTSVADQKFSISCFYNTLGFTITNTSAPYAICGSIIVMCMFATTLRNLIYKVLSLAVLSVFVVALWAYLTDVTFIYVVYILTFVSAVVMLFLSVVLMLPSSAVAVTKRNFLFVLSTATISTSEIGIVSAIADITADIVYFCLTLAAAYFVLAFFKSWRARSTFKNYGHPHSDVILTTEDVPENAPAWRYIGETGAAVNRFAENYNFYVYDGVFANTEAVHNCKYSSADDAKFGTIKQYLRGNVWYRAEYGQRPVKDYSLNIFKLKYDSQLVRLTHVKGISPASVVRTYYPRYIRAVPRLIGPWYEHNLHHWPRALLLVAYELINFYVHRLEPDLFLGFKSYVAITASLRKFANATPLCVEYDCYKNGRRSPIMFYAGGDPVRLVYLSIYTPWWSPFRVFGKKSDLNVNIIDRAVRRLAVRLDNYYSGKRKNSNTPTINSFIPPALVDLVSNAIARLFSHITEYYRAFLDAHKLHPALAFKLAASKSTKLSTEYVITLIYYKTVNFIFNNVELPLSSKTGSKSIFSIFSGFYDLITPIYNSGILSVAYNVRPGQYTVNNVQSNKLTFIKNFIIFTLVNLLFNLANVVVCVIVFLTSSTNIELVMQIVTTISMFFIAVPVGLAGSWALFTYSFYLVDAGASNFAENLAAVQQGLYVSQPLLLLISITGLLVALIGAPFFVSRGNK